MPRLKSILTYLNKLAPLEYAPKWDNVGLLVEPTIYSQTNPNSQNLSKILLTNDLTLKVLDEALQKKVNMIISQGCCVKNACVNASVFLGLFALCVELFFSGE